MRLYFYITVIINIRTKEKITSSNYYILAKKFHPDVNKDSTERFKEINEAYEILGCEI